MTTKTGDPESLPGWSPPATFSNHTSSPLHSRADAIQKKRWQDWNFKPEPCILAAMCHGDQNVTWAVGTSRARASCSSQFRPENFVGLFKGISHGHCPPSAQDLGCRWGQERERWEFFPCITAIETEDTRANIWKHD